MKKIISGILLLVLFVIAAYEVTGILTQRVLTSNLSVLNQSTDMVAEITQYRRGLFRSKAILVVNVQVPQTYRIQLPMTIYHGPLIWNGRRLLIGLGFMDAQLDITPEYEKLFTQRFMPESTKPQVGIQVFVDLKKVSHINAQLLPFKLQTRADKSQLQWNGMDSTTVMTRGMRHVKGDIAVKGVSFTKDNVLMQLSHLTSQYDLKQTKNHLFVGDLNVALPDFLLKKGTERLVELKALNIHSNNQIHDGLFSSHLNVTFRSLFNKKLLGPAVVTVSLKNLDADVLAKIHQHLKKMQSQQQPVDQKQMLFSLAPKIPALLAKGAVLEVSELTITTPEGTVEADLTLGLPEDPNLNVFQIYHKLSGNGTVKLPVAMVQGMLKDSIQQRLLLVNNASNMEKEAQTLMEKQINNMISRGALVVQGTNYIIHMKLSKGRLTINNKPFSEMMTLSFASEEESHSV